MYYVTNAKTLCPQLQFRNRQGRWILFNVNNSRSKARLDDRTTIQVDNPV